MIPTAPIATMPVPVTLTVASDIKPRPTSGGQMLHSIQCMRFIAASLVVIYHAYITLVPSALDAPMVGAAYVFGFGKVGVHIFFVISGYIMYLTSFARAGKFRTGQFFLRRLVRIYPIYWIFVALYLVVTAMLDVMPILSPVQFVGMLALVPGSAPMVIGPAWTLSFELYFYFVFGIIMVLGARRGTVALTAVFIGSVAVGMVLRPSYALGWVATNVLLLEFCMGVWVARLTANHFLPRGAGWLAVAGAVSFYAAGLAWGYERLSSAILWGVPSALLIMGMVILEQRGQARLMRRLSWLGDSSYVLYLCHILLITLVMSVLHTIGLMPPLALMMIATTIGCILFAVVFHAVIERPLTAVLHRVIVLRKASATIS